MNIRITVLAAALALGSIGAAHADGLRPIQAQAVDLGGMSGVAYYTAERDGFRVVATLAQGETGVPVRFEAVLTPGQSVVLSTPRALGVLADAVEISREDNAVFVRKDRSSTSLPYQASAATGISASTTPRRAP